MTITLQRYRNHFVRRHYTGIGMALVMVLFVAAGIPEILKPMNSSWEHEYIKTSIEDCHKYGQPFQRAVLKFWQFCISHDVFGNHKILPFIESAGILLLVYGITSVFSRRGWPGLLAASCVAASQTFTMNAPTGYFSTEWAFLFLLGIWCIYKRPEASGLFYSLSLFAKGITILYYPFVAYMIIASPISRRQKAVSLASTGAVIPLTVIWTLFVGDNILQTDIPIGYQDNLEAALYNPVWNFTHEKNDHVALLGLIPAAFVLLYLARRRFPMSWPLMGFLGYMFSMQVWIPLFSAYSMGDYRNIVLVAVMGIAVGASTYHAKDRMRKYGPAFIILVYALVMFAAVRYLMLGQVQFPI